jgi:xylulokinase
VNLWTGCTICVNLRTAEYNARMPRRHLLGIDVSTTGVKALIIDDHGTVVASETTPLALSTPQPLWAEQRPEDWWQAAVASLRRLLARREADARAIAAIGLTGQMHGLVLLDAEGRVLRPAILWNDQRTSVECDEIRAAVGLDRLIQVTGNDALTGFTAPKLLWVRRHEPDVWARARTMLLPKDYVRFRLTGALATDKADASGTLLFDLARRDWSIEIADVLGVPRAWLPAAHEGPQRVGAISADASAATGLAAGTPVVAGGGDQSAGAVGVGVVEPGMVSVVLGTSGVVFAATDRPVVEPAGRLHAFCHAVPEKWHLMGVMLSAAGSLQWYRDAFAPSTDFDRLVNEASDVPPGAGGLVFLPYLTGELTPHPDPFARGAFVGLTRQHGRAQLTRAVLEGVAFGLKDCFDLIVRACPGLPALSLAEGKPGTYGAKIRISGGGAKSALWRRIVASVLDVRVERVNSSEGAAFGAALLAGVGAGVWPDVRTACQQTIATTGVDEPVEAWREPYARTHDIYKALYPALSATFARLHQGNRSGPG